jgi:hypothetical protein
MKYRIDKPADDSRAFIAGIVLPDGFFRIIDLTRYNGDNILHMEKEGYQVVELPEDDDHLTGLYELGTHRRITDDSALAHADMRVQGQLAEAPATYVDPASYLGMPPDKKAAKLGRKPRRADPASAARGEKIAREGLKQTVSENRAAVTLGVNKRVVR